MQPAPVLEFYRQMLVLPVFTTAFFTPPRAMRFSANAQRLVQICDGETQHTLGLNACLLGFKQATFDVNDVKLAGRAIFVAEFDKIPGFYERLNPPLLYDCHVACSALRCDGILDFAKCVGDGALVLRRCLVGTRFRGSCGTVQTTSTRQRLCQAAALIPS